MYCNIVFKYSDDTIPETVKKIVQTEFMMGRNEVIELLNPNYEKWNDEFKKEYGTFDDYDIPEYNNFIKNKMEEVFKDFNDPFLRYVQFYATSDCDIAAWFNYHNKKIHMFMELTNLKEQL